MTDNDESTMSSYQLINVGSGIPDVSDSINGRKRTVFFKQLGIRLCILFHYLLYKIIDVIYNDEK